ncbi:C-terminal processing protease CtpA/Prc [Balneicella halophila]|uniref:Tricorn protease homolog n=1 Tax=Balneicella halophila TaxID=1537566 RepID=A0A7L4UN61_BALHA|nr:S41 family peptidase [Balneicella halophila]PVX49996.1 C-terminal processing protease CtpA/Prc [Balneicella halophila]
MKKVFLIFFMMVTSWIAWGETPLWMRYPAISPDGQQIAFSYQGDIFVVPTRGGRALQLTRHEGHDTQPVWTPDSKQIVFASDRYGNFDLFRMNAIGGSATRLTFHSGSEKPESITPDGKYVLFTALIQDDPDNYMFPTGVLPELYQVPLKGGQLTQVLTSPAENAVWTKDQKTLLYHDKKGYEDPWRKHHQSSVTRDVWKYDAKTEKHTKLTTFPGEDRNPVSDNNGNIYYLTEQFGTFNVAKMPIDNPSAITQVSKFQTHPVRFLTISDQGKLCYSYNGEIYTQLPNEKPQKLSVSLFVDDVANEIVHLRKGSGISEMAVSPNGKEVAFIIRGEVFVTSTDYKTTKRITDTPEQERSVSFSPDGDAILYAGERNGSWNLYQTKKVRDEEKYFANSTLLKEEVILESPEETFQPSYSPDGKEVAFIENRAALRVINLDSKKTRTIVPSKLNFSYSDGDQWYDWSPDGKWFVVRYLDKNLWIGEVGLVSAKGGEEVINLTQSGYEDNIPKWMMDGEMIIWTSDKAGYRSHGSWGAEDDVYAMFLTQEAYDKFQLSKEEFELEKELEKDDDKDEESKDNDKDEEKDKSKEKDDKTFEPIKIELDGIEDRVERLTINSSQLSDAIVTPDGKKLYYMSRFEGGFDLWRKNLLENKTELVFKLKGGGGGFAMDKDAENLFFVSGGSIYKMPISSEKKKNISYSAEFELDKAGEREYIFEHAWRQVKRKFYDPDIHGLDWEGLKKNYAKFLPHINNNYDFSEMLGELLGELNGSHTGARYRHRDSNGDNTASLGILVDYDYNKKGIKIAEILENGPLDKAKLDIKVGDVITHINKEEINPNNDYFKLLNRKKDENVVISLARGGKKWDEVIKPISRGEENTLLYNRWVKIMRAETERLSNGRLGYVHVKGMNSPSFREVYSDLLGRYADKEAVVVDTRFNGGGWLHDDLVTLLSGKPYWTLTPRGQVIGTEPLFKWSKPSILLMGEGNYSDAHGFPYAYKELGIGKLVGMPVPGTFTAVWWETQIDNSIVFGIPQVGAKGMDGKYLENQQLEPDLKVRNEIEEVTNGRDQQLEAAVKEMLRELDNK